MKFISSLLAFLVFFLAFSGNVFAIEDPLATSNNKMGIHILFPSELGEAASIVNSNGGDWGYVTIPIQTNDRNLEKWQIFMNEAKKYHLIPILRLATEGDYFNNNFWSKPNKEDVLDFANFLNSLDWPVKNRYIIVFNEVNRGDEWNGNPNPAEYAQILDYAVDAFKAKNDDFFIISAGLDNAAITVPNTSYSEYTYMTMMNDAVPGIFKKIDGLGSHSYPNPAFAIAPWVQTSKSVTSFKYEKNLAYLLSSKNLPVFITETGWSTDRVPINQIASYFHYAFESVWSDKDIVAVTPFLLQAGSKPFSQFSILSASGGDTDISSALEAIVKIKGNPTINFNTKITENKNDNSKNLPVKRFSTRTQYSNPFDGKVKTVSSFFKWILKLST